MLDHRLPVSESPAVQIFAEAWCAVLGVARVSSDDNFFDLGGDSLAVLKLIVWLRNKGYELHLSDIYDTPKFAAAVTRVAVLANEPDSAEHVAYRLPLLPVQERTLEYDRIAPDYHNDDVVYALPDGLTTEAVVECVARLIRRHPTLSTRFHLEGDPYQEIGTDVDIRAAVEICVVAPGDSDKVRELGVRAHNGFDLRAGRVFAARVLTWKRRPWALALVAHHLVCDLMSWHAIAADLAQAFDAIRDGTSYDPPASTSYSRWAGFLATQAATGAYDKHLAYWRGRPWHAVGRVPRLTAQPDRSLGGLRLTRVRTDLGDGSGFRRAAAGLGGDAIVTGALAHALHAVHGITTAVIDVVVNGRDQVPGAPDISGTVGYLAEFAPVVTELGGTVGTLTAVRTAAAQFRRVPAPRIAFGVLRHMHPDPAVRAEFRALPAADFYLNYRGNLLHSGDSALPELDYSLGPFQSPDEQQGYPARIMVDFDGTGIRSLWKFSPTELPTADVEDLIQAFHEALRAISEA